MKKKIVKSKKRLPKYQDGAFIGPLDESTTVAKDKEKEAKVRGLIDDLITPKSAPIVTTPKSVAAKNSKTISDSYKKSLQGLMDKGKSIDELVKLGYGTKQGLTNLGLTAPKKSAAPKPTASKKGGSPKPTTPKKPTASDLKKEGQRLKAEGMKQKGIGMAIKGKGLRNKAIAETKYIKIGTSQDPITTKLREISKGKKQTKEVKYLPNKSVLTETEKKAIAKYKASPKYKKSLKLDSKKLNKKLAKQNEDTYRPNIVGDLIGGPVKAAAAAVGVGAGLYGLYKAGKNLSNVGKAVTKSIATKTAKAGASQLAANTARKVRSITATNKRALNVVKDRLAKRGSLENILKQTSKPNLKNITKRNINRESILYRQGMRGKRNTSLSKFERYAKSKVIKPSNKRFNYNREARKEMAQTELKGALDKVKNRTSKFLEKFIERGKPKQFRKGGKVTKMKRNGKKC